MSSKWKGEQELSEALESLATAKGISANRIKAASATCMKWAKEYKRVVHAVENALWKSENEHRLAYLYLIDAVIRTSQSKHGEGKDPFSKRFGLHLRSTLGACRKVSTDVQANAKRVVSEWIKRGVFTTTEIEEADGADFLRDGALDPPPLHHGEKNHTNKSALIENPEKLASLINQVKWVSTLKHDEAVQPDNHNSYSEPQNEQHSASLLPRSTSNSYPGGPSSLLPNPSDRFDGPGHSRSHDDRNSTRFQSRESNLPQFESRNSGSSSLDRRDPRFESDTSGGSRYDPRQQRSPRYDSRNSGSKYDSRDSVSQRYDQRDGSSSKFDSRSQPYYPQDDSGSRYDSRNSNVSRFDNRDLESSRYDQRDSNTSRSDVRSSNPSNYHSREHDGQWNESRDAPQTRNDYSDSGRFNNNRHGSRETAPPSRFGGDSSASTSRFGPPRDGPSRFDGPSTQNDYPPQRNSAYTSSNRSEASPRTGQEPPAKRMRSRSRSRSPKRRGIAPCRDFQNGRCTRGSNCRHSHDVEAPGSPKGRSAPANHPKNNPHQVKTKLCTLYPNCRFGDRCTFAHNETELGTSYTQNLDDRSPKEIATNTANAQPPVTTSYMQPEYQIHPCPDTSDNSSAPRQRRSRWEDKKNPILDEPPTTAPSEVKDDDEQPEAAAPEFILEYDDEN